MYQGKRILSVVPARGGSKGIPLKNIHPLNGQPLLHWTAKFHSDLDFVDKAVVSTDSDQIAEVARSSGLEAPFMRPESLSGDQIGDLDVLTHALLECERLDDMQYDVVLMLQPTSPFRKRRYITDALDLLLENEADSVWSVSTADKKFHPFKQLTLTDERLDYYDERGKTIIARQQLGDLYYRNGIVYAITRDCLLEKKSIRGDHSCGLVIDDLFVNIDGLLEFEWAEYLLQKGLVSL